MTRAEIMFNYRQAIRQAEKLESLAKRLNRLADNTMDSAIGTLRSAWSSDHSGEYFKKADKVKEDIGKSADNLKSIASAIRRVAKTVKEAELKALREAQRRSYRS